MHGLDFFTILRLPSSLPSHLFLSLPLLLSIARPHLQLILPTSFMMGKQLGKCRGEWDWSILLCKGDERGVDPRENIAHKETLCCRVRPLVWSTVKGWWIATTLWTNISPTRASEVRNPNWLLDYIRLIIYTIDLWSLQTRSGSQRRRCPPHSSTRWVGVSIDCYLDGSNEWLIISIITWLKIFLVNSTRLQAHVAICVSQIDHRWSGNLRFDIRAACAFFTINRLQGGGNSLATVDIAVGYAGLSEYQV